MKFASSFNKHALFAEKVMKKEDKPFFITDGETKFLKKR
jgi:hypothetical protein